MIEIERENRSKIASKQQLSAANPDTSVWVEASAGTGKTKVLSDRVLRLLLNSETPHPERILCLTYTKAGAVEMKSRIFERLSEWSVISDEKLQESLLKLFPEGKLSFKELSTYKERARTLFAILLDTAGGMKIQTIHSFCQDILARFPIEAGVSPYFEVIEGEEQTDILEQIRRDLLNDLELSASNTKTKYMLYITENMKESNFDKSLQEIIENSGKLQNIFNRYRNFSDFEQALARKIGAEPDKLIVDYYNDFMEYLRPRLSEIIDTLNHGSAVESETAAALNIIVQNNFNIQDFSIAETFFFHKKASKLKGTKTAREYNPAFEQLAQNVFDKMSDTLHQITRQKLFFASRAIFGLAHELFAKYNEYKKKRAKLDYNDLIFYTNRLLSNSSASDWVLYKLDGGIDHILVDEAQDTSPEQWGIIKALSEEFFAGEGSKKEQGTIFVVGDRKQSIFSFQGADPQKMEEMSQYFKTKAQGNFEKINLDVSFRSTSAVLDTVNKIFSQPEACAGVVAENEKVNHLPYRVGEWGKVEIWPLLVKDTTPKDADVADDERSYLAPKKTPSLKYQLAVKIALKIKELIAQSLNTPRPLHFGDFMILVQKRAHFMNEFIRACKENNVNVSGADRINLSEQIAIQDLISLAKFLLLPNDDLSLAEVLKSPLFNFNDDDLFKLCWNRKNANLWSRLKDFDEYRTTYEKLQYLFNQVDFMRPFELFNFVLTQMNGRHNFILRMGYEVEDALDEFMNLVLNFEQEHIPSMQNFVEWISTHNCEVKREAKQNDTDAVRFMTAHGSKGLQARVVFLPDTTVSDQIKNGQKLLIDNDNEIAYYPFNKDYYDEKCVDANQATAFKEAQERRRLLYVALTRAEDELYICGYANSEKKVSPDSWYSLCRQILEKEGKEQTNGEYVYETAGDIISKLKSASSMQESVPEIPNWISTPAKPENALSKPYTPSKLDDDEDVDSISPLIEQGNYFKRGTIIHKMLQFLPNSKENRSEIITKYLAQNGFSDKEQNQIITEVSAVLNTPEFADIFGEYSQAEVPVMGEINGRIISAQIDRLIIMPDKIKIVDFKTNRRIDEIPEAYVNQLKVYAQLIKKIYPYKPIETYILWTNKLKLTKVA